MNKQYISWEGRVRRYRGIATAYRKVKKARRIISKLWCSRISHLKKNLLTKCSKKGTNQSKHQKNREKKLFLFLLGGQFLTFNPLSLYQYSTIRTTSSVPYYTVSITCHGILCYINLYWYSIRVYKHWIRLQYGPIWSEF
jgi:hypothetical protein